MSSLDEELRPVVPSKAMARPWGMRASRAEAVEFAEHLAGLTRSGLPLPSGLRALGAELPSRRLRRDMAQMADRLEQGDGGSDAAARQLGLAGRFPPQLRGLLIAGARAGKLGDILGQYVRYANLGADLRRRFWAALGYPLFLLVAMAGLYVLVCVWIVDAFRFILKDFGMEVPAITQALFWMADVTTSRGPSIAATGAVLALIVLAVFRLTMGPAERRMIVTGIPLFGPVLRWSSLAEFCHLTGLLVEAEMPLPAALDLAGGAVGDAELARAGANLRASVEQGRTLSDSLGAWPGCPAGLRETLGGSEGRGDLASSLHLAGDMCEARARTQAAFSTTLVAAVTILVVLWGIGLVLTGLYLPIWVLFRRFV